MYKKIFLFVFLVLYSSYCVVYAQTTKFSCAREIACITDVPYYPELSGDSLYWNLVIQGKAVVPCLISNLTNTTKTNIVIPNFGGYYCVGDVSYSIICQIIRNVPIENFIRENKMYPLSEDLTYMSFVTYKRSNRHFLKKKISKWYKENEDRLEWVVDTNNYRAARDWYYSSNTNPAHGYYIVRSQKNEKDKTL